MASILEQIGTKVGEELKTLDIRLSSAETAIVNLGGQTPPPTGNFTIEPVNWTNISEINLSGEKLLNTDFSSVYSQYVADPSNDGSNRGSASYPVKLIVLTSVDLGGTIFSAGSILNGVGGGGANDSLIRMEDPDDPRDRPYTTTNQNTGTWAWHDWANRGITWEYAKLENLPTNWSVLNGTLDETQLANGIIQGDGGAVAIKQTFAQIIPTGTELVLKATRADSETGNIRFNPIRATDGVAMSANIGIDPSVGYATYTTTVAISGVKIDTLHGLREIDSVSIFKGAVSGGSVQTYTGGSIEKISGVGGYSAGASSVQKIDGQKGGYVQFQIASATSAVQIGLVNQDHDFEVDAPWKMIFGGGHIDFSEPWIGDHTPYVVGDWFRIRHYSQENEINFQKRELIYQVNTTSSYEVGTKIMILRDFSSAVKDEIVTVYFVSSSGVPSFEQDDGTQFGAQAGITGYGRTDWWEVAESIGEDYVTFYTHPSLSNGSDLYVDASFYSVGSRVNDVQIAIQDS